MVLSKVRQGNNEGGKVNRSVEAFVYCILGAQVNTRSSISGNSGSAQETQQEMLQLFESAIFEEDISKSIQRFQLSVQEAKLRLDFAIAPGIWLMPSDLILNTGSVVGYNNKLTKATGSMKFGVNDSVNVENRPVGIKHNLGTSKVKLPHSLKPVAKARETPLPVTQTKEKDDVNASVPVARSTKRVAPTTNVHEDNLAALTIAAAGVGWWMFR